MLHPIKPICDPKKVRRDGTSLIYIQYCYSSENRTLLNTEIAIPPKYWVKKNLSISKALPAEYGEADKINNSLSRMQRVTEDLIALADRQGIADKGSFVKQVFKPSLDVEELAGDRKTMEVLSHEVPRARNGLYDQIDDYIGSKKRKVTKATLTVFKNVKMHLQAFEAYRMKPITFESFDYAFYADFIDFLTFEYIQPRRKEITQGLRVNTIGKTIRQFRIFIRDRVRRKLIAPIDLTDFKIPEEETDSIYLTYDEIARMYTTDLSHHPHLVEYRDLFVLACLTGLRFSDLSVLRPDDLRNNLLYKKQEKSDHWVVIPMRQISKEIFTSQFQEKIPDLTNPEFNRHIKTIGKLAGLDTLITFASKKGSENVVQYKPKYEWITSHTARRSFCTNEFLAGTPVKLIMKISGHKKEQSFYRYIRVSPEEAAMKIEKLWAGRDDMQAFKLGKLI